MEWETPLSGLPARGLDWPKMTRLEADRLRSEYCVQYE